MSKYPKITDDEFYEKINNIYKSFRVRKEDRTLDEICHPKEFKLQLPQKFLAEFIHIKMFKGKYLKYGYGQTSFIGSIKKSLRETPFQLLDIGYFDIYYPVQFAPRVIKPFIRKILRFRPFWPIAYVEIMKPLRKNKI